jgi:hypothetical protein
MTNGAREEIAEILKFILITGENGGMDSPTLVGLCRTKLI